MGRSRSVPLRDGGQVLLHLLIAEQPEGPAVRLADDAHLHTAHISRCWRVAGTPLQVHAAQAAGHTRCDALRCIEWCASRPRPCRTWLPHSTPRRHRGAQTALQAPGAAQAAPKQGMSVRPTSTSEGLKSSDSTPCSALMASCAVCAWPSCAPALSFFSRKFSASWSFAPAPVACV